MAKAHWEEFRPAMVSYLKTQGIYLKVLEEVDDKTRDEIAGWVSRGGAKVEQAKELVLPKWIYLPSEESVPILPDWPYPQPPETTS